HGAWRRGRDLYAEVRLTAGQVPDAARYGVHPALLDAVLHPVVGETRAEGGARAGDGTRRPSFWTAGRVDAPGAAAARGRMSPVGADGVAGADGAISLLATAVGGRIVMTAESLTLRSVAPGSLPGGAGRQPLRRVAWTPVPLPTEPPSAESLSAD